MAHDREVWLAAIQTLEIVRSMADVKDVEGWLDNFIEMVTLRKQEKPLASPDEMARMAKQWR